MPQSKSSITKWLVGAGVSAAAALGGGYLVIPYEGAVKDKQGMHVAYLDAVGVPTICYGQTGKDLYGRTIKLGMKLSEEECLDMLSKTLIKFDKEVSSAVKVPYASPYQKAALLSFTYNVGVGNLKSSTLLRKLNAGQHEEACEELSKWVYAQKKKLRGLVTRREDEKQWCMGHVPAEAEMTYSEIAKMVSQTSDKR